MKTLRRDAKLGPIPQTKKEVATLGNLYGASRSGLFVGGQSTKERAKAEMPRFRVLHFATQGILAGNDPRYSYVLLSRSGSTQHAPCKSGKAHAGSARRLRGALASLRPWPGHCDLLWGTKELAGALGS